MLRKSVSYFLFCSKGNDECWIVQIYFMFILAYIIIMFGLAYIAMCNFRENGRGVGVTRLTTNFPPASETLGDLPPPLLENRFSKIGLAFFVECVCFGVHTKCVPNQTDVDKDSAKEKCPNVCTSVHFLYICICE
jgi:hypothetical protein